MITFLCWYFGISIAYTALLYLFLTSDKVFCLLLEYSKNTQFNAYLNLRSTMVYIPITTITLSVLFFPINFILKTLTIIFEFIVKGFVKIFGEQEEKFRLKRKYSINSGDDDNK